MTHKMALLFEAAEGSRGLDVSEHYSTWRFMLFSIILFMQDLLILPESGVIFG